MSVGRLLAQPVKVREYYGANSSGVAFFRPGVEFPARVEYTRQMVRKSSGSEVIAEVTVYLDAAADALADPRNKLLLPGDAAYDTVLADNNQSGHQVLTWGAQVDRHGQPHHVVATTI